MSRHERQLYELCLSLFVSSSSSSLSFAIHSQGLTCTTACSGPEPTFNYVILNTSLHGPDFAKAEIE